MPSEPLRPHLSMPPFAAACAAAIVAAIAVAGCGGSSAPTPSVPSGQGGSDAAVARVADQEITRAQFERALHARVSGISPFTPGTTATMPLDAPAFTRCAAATARQLRAAKTPDPPRPSLLRRNCAIQYQQVRKQTMSSLIQQAWIVQEAKASGVKVDEQVAAALKAYRRAAGFERRLTRSGLTLADVRSTVAAQMLTTQLARAGVSAKPPTKRQLRRFVAEHPGLFGTAGRRTIDVVAAPTPAAAEKAKAALEKGTSAQAIIAGLPTSGTVRQGRFTVTDGDGQLGPPLNAAVFAARSGRVVGPVKVGQLYYVAKIRSTRAAKIPPFSKLAAQAQQMYLSQRAQDAQTAFQAKLAKTWRPKTACARGYIVPECGNAAAATTKTTATTA